MLVKNLSNPAPQEHSLIFLRLVKADSGVAHDVIQCEAELLEHLKEDRILLCDRLEALWQTLELLLRLFLVNHQLLPQHRLELQDHFSLVGDQGLDQHRYAFLLCRDLSEIFLGQDDAFPAQHIVERDPCVILCLGLVSHTDGSKTFVHLAEVCEEVLVACVNLCYNGHGALPLGVVLIYKLDRLACHEVCRCGRHVQDD